MKQAGLKSKCFVIVAITMSIMVFAMPILAQQADLGAGRVAGSQAARASTNGTLWLGAGCFLTWLGIVIAYVYEPNPPATVLLGKSPEYVAAYTDGYKMTAKSIQTSKAWTGCIVGALVQVAAYTLLVVAAEAVD